jgi:DNA-binding CsgD family transcriptional regulator
MESRVLNGASLGKTNAQIGHQLEVSEDTVKMHLVRIYRKLGVGDRAAAVRVAMERGVLRPRPGTALAELVTPRLSVRRVSDRHIAACFAAEACPCRREVNSDG